MGNWWSVRPGNEGSGDDVSVCTLYDTVLTDAGAQSTGTEMAVEDISSGHASPSEIIPPFPPRSTRPRKHMTGFGQFCVELASLLAIVHIEKLATLFEYPRGLIDEINRSNNPGQKFVQLMEERGQISPNSISGLISAMESIQLVGVAATVQEKFKLYADTLPTTQGEAFTKSLRTMEMLLSQLKSKYEDMYNAVQPISYIRDKLRCVARVFVESGIEYFVGEDTVGGHGQWKKLSSYQDIFKNPHVSSTRRVLEADPGFGKSTITLQIAYDWCNSAEGSILHGLKIFILLQLKQMGGVKSVYTAIKRFLLPKDSALTEDDVKSILQNASSVLIVFDGFDEYPDRESEESSDFISIIKRDMFQHFDVIVTTRTACLPRELSSQTKRIRLTGFDDDARDHYIRKAVVSDDEEAITKIKDIFRKNSVLADLCQVPLFFSLFAHVIHEATQLETFNTVTTFFRHMIVCFHQHMKNKMSDKEFLKCAKFVKQHEVLNKVAFDGLNRSDQKIIWRKDDMQTQIGKDFYDYYVRVGILVEEDVLDIGDDDVFAVDFDSIQYVTKVHFFHKVFCEWYAAHYLSKSASEFKVSFTKNEIYYPAEFAIGEENFDEKHSSQVDSLTDITQLDPLDVQYVYRFACGISTVAAEQIIKYLRNQYGSMFEVLCILEQSKGKLTNVLEDVDRMCSKDVPIRDTDNMLIQRTKVQLLHIASSNKIDISEVWLYYSFSSIDPSCRALNLHSDLVLQALETLCKLVIVEDGETMLLADIHKIFHYSIHCKALRKLRFIWCLLPQSIPVEILSVLRPRGIKVKWSPSSLLYHYRLNLKSGFWEDGVDGNVITDAEYTKLVDYFHHRLGREESVNTFL